MQLEDRAQPGSRPSCKWNGLFDLTGSDQLATRPVTNYPSLITLLALINRQCPQLAVFVVNNNQLVLDLVNSLLDLCQSLFTLDLVWVNRNQRPSTKDIDKTQTIPRTD